MPIPSMCERYNGDLNIGNAFLKLYFRISSTVTIFCTLCWNSVIDIEIHTSTMRADTHRFLTNIQDSSRSIMLY